MLASHLAAGLQPIKWGTVCCASLPHRHSVIVMCRGHLNAERPRLAYTEPMSRAALQCPCMDSYSMLTETLTRWSI